MLIQIGRPKLRPSGNTVLRVRRDHALTQDIRGLFLFGGAYGVGRDLVTGADFTPNNTPTIGLSPEGPGADFTGTAYLSAVKQNDWNITGAVSIGWRGVIRTPTVIGNIVSNLPAGGNGISNTPFGIEYNNNVTGAPVFARSGAGGARIWKSDTANTLVANKMQSLSVSQPGEISTMPALWVDGALSTMTTFFGSGTGAASTNSDPLWVGRRPDGAEQMNGVTNIILLAATEWSTGQHMLWDQAAWTALEEAPRYYFVPSGPVNVSVALTGVAIAGSSGTLIPASSVAVTGSTATLSAGTVTPVRTLAATGSAITSSAGTVTPATSLSLSGSAATASAGTLGYSAALAFTGTAITSAAGTLIAGLGVAITGAAITSAGGTLGYSASLSVSGASMSAAGGTLGTTGGTMPVNVSLRGELVRVVPGNVRVRGGTRWVEPTPQAVALPSTIDNTLPPPPRLTGDAQSDLRAQQQWLATVYDQVVKRLNMLGRIVDHEDRLNRLENPDTTN